MGVITPSSSPWSSPVLLVPKKMDNFASVWIFVSVNELTVKDAYPIPRIDETLDGLYGTKCFSTLDLASGYWQVVVALEDRAKTAFSTNGSLTNDPQRFNY